MDMSVRHFLQVNDVVAGLAGSDAADGARRILLRDCLVVHYDRLHRRLLRHLGCADLASDCLHDAWLRLGDMAVSAAIQSPQAYVYRVACNIAIDRLRSSRPWQQTDDAGCELEQLADAA